VILLDSKQRGGRGFTIFRLCSEIEVRGLSKHANRPGSHIHSSLLSHSQDPTQHG
jgi:hypothetical protein